MSLIFYTVPLLVKIPKIIEGILKVSQNDIDDTE